LALVAGFAVFGFEAAPLDEAAGAWALAESNAPHARMVLAAARKRSRTSLLLASRSFYSLLYGLATSGQIEDDRLGPKNLVLLPGLDGTGRLFRDFIAALPASLNSKVVCYPPDRSLGYADLLSFVIQAVPSSEPFVLLAESFSTPLALAYAATKPANLAGVILCAGFVRNPVGAKSFPIRCLAGPWAFRIDPPRWAIEYFLCGRQAPLNLVAGLREALKSVRPEVLSFRVREILNCDARRDLARVSSPCMYLRAANDRVVSKSSSEEILKIRPDIRSETIVGPHLILQREPEKTARLVANFIQSLDI